MASSTGRRLETRVRERIFHVGWNDRVNSSVDQTVIFQFPQVSGEHFGGCTWRAFLQNGKATWPVQQFPQNELACIFRP